MFQKLFDLLLFRKNSKASEQTVSKEKQSVTPPSERAVSQSHNSDLVDKIRNKIKNLSDSKRSLSVHNLNLSTRSRNIFYS